MGDQVAHASGQTLPLHESRLIELAAHQQVRAPQECGLQPFAFEIGPVLEGRSTGHTKLGEEVPDVELDGSIRLAALKRGQEAIPVDVDRGAEGEFLRADEDLFPEKPPEVEEHLPQGTAGAFRVEIGPQEVEQELPGSSATGGQGEVDEEGERLPRAQNRLEGLSGIQPSISQGPEGEGGWRLSFGGRYSGHLTGP